jgi:hypothetical protein
LIAWFSLAGWGALGVGRAAGQACHFTDLRVGAPERPWRLSLNAIFASYRNRVYAGEYQGALVAASYRHPWVAAEASFGGYRIVRNGLREYGASDVSLDVRGTVARFSELSLGLELAATLPTGDPGRGLGMGHVMLMPGAFFQLEGQRLSLLVQVAYGRALITGAEHVHSSPTGPLVNPMNRSEIEHAATLAYVFRSPLFAATRLSGAVPVGALGGAAREALGIAFGASLDHFQTSAELQLPLVGTPFTSRFLLSAAGTF